MGAAGQVGRATIGYVIWSCAVYLASIHSSIAVPLPKIPALRQPIRFQVRTSNLWSASCFSTMALTALYEVRWSSWQVPCSLQAVVAVEAALQACASILTPSVSHELFLVVWAVVLFSQAGRAVSSSVPLFSQFVRLF